MLEPNSRSLTIAVVKGGLQGTVGSLLAFKMSNCYI
jgi:hypothetical protein